jgi:hypothetical protein
MSEFKDIIIDGTLKTPHIEFNHLTGKLLLSGRSFPENAAELYEPLVNWTNDYIKSPHHTTDLHLKLEYLNSTSLIWLVKIVKTLSKIDQEDSCFYIHLYFDDENFDIRDADELKDTFYSLFNMIGKLKVTIAIKTYAIDKDGNSTIDSTIVI